MEILREGNRMKTLIAWFSWSGNTRDIAERIARKTRGELFRIEREVPYSTDYSICAYREAREEADKQLRPAIRGPLPDIAEYDTVIIAFPIWWYTAPTIINTFIETYGFEGKTVIFFATSGSSDIAGADKQFHAQYPDINWKAGKLLNNASRKLLQDWVASNK